MTFDVRIDGNEVWTMRAAGVDVRAYQALHNEVITGRVKLPATAICPYFLADGPTEVRITVVAFKPQKHLLIDAPDVAIAEAIQREIERFAPLSVGDAWDRRHQALVARIDAILEPDGVTVRDVESGRVTLSRRAQHALMRLCEEVHFADRHLPYWQFVRGGIPNEDRTDVTGWLLERFAAERDPVVRSDINTVFLNRNDLVRVELADDAIRLLKDWRYGSSRAGMIFYLTSLRHPQAPALIASVMHEDGLTWTALRSLGDLKASEHEERVRQYLRDSNSEIRLEARRALKKMGCPVPQPPKPVHLAGSQKRRPAGLEEWSTGLDLDRLGEVLTALIQCVDSGFGPDEVAEIVSVAENMKPDQTRVFQFPIALSGRQQELWLEIFMDDINAPDLAIHAPAAVIRDFTSKVDLPG